MKKTLFVLLCAALIVLSTSCRSALVSVVEENETAKSNDNESSYSENNTEETEEVVEVEAVVEATEEVEEDSNPLKEFAADITVIGEVAENVQDINSNIITLNNVDYAISSDRYSKLFENGWKCSLTFDDSFEPQKTTQLFNFYLSHPDNATLTLGKAINDTYRTLTLKECIIGSLSFNIMEYTDYETDEKLKTDFILPGGITSSSTAANILEIFGIPGKCEEFKSGKIDEDSLNYYNNVKSGISLYFTFHADGSLKAFSMSCK